MINNNTQSFNTCCCGLRLNAVRDFDVLKLSE